MVRWPFSPSCLRRCSKSSDSSVVNGSEKFYATTSLHSLQMDDHKPTPFNWWFLSDWFAQKMPWSFRLRKYSKICTDILHSTWTNSISNMCLKSLCRDPFRFWWFLHHESLLVFITLTAPKVQPQAIGWTMGRREFHLQGGKTPMRRMMVVHGGEGDGVSVFVCFHGGGRFLWECCLCWWWQWSYCGGVVFLLVLISW